MVQWGAMRLFLLAVLLAGSAIADNPNVVNGDFEMPRIGAPFLSTVAVPGWIHNGATGLGNLARVGYTDGFGEIVLAGHGSQFLLIGSGPETRGDASWSTNIT